MADKYELHIIDFVKEGGFADLKKLVEKSEMPYEIYVIKQSKMNSQKGKKFGDEQIEMAIRMIGKGRSKKDVAGILHVHPSNLNRMLLAYDKDYNLRPVKL